MYILYFMGNMVCDLFHIIPLLVAYFDFLNSSSDKIYVMIHILN
ncbi:hypothetical protein [Plasmodium yoelii yoelii]|uniref:Uncharacterized protein n=1 Tax=Plasmodium yoelii yoelii TaxID=73239 RepID=Q7R7D0_PLAYO|nr:hypothetical protein [Plasmodium yoelii yoelii]